MTTSIISLAGDNLIRLSPLFYIFRNYTYLSDKYQALCDGFRGQRSLLLGFFDIYQAWLSPDDGELRLHGRSFCCDSYGCRSPLIRDRPSWQRTCGSQRRWRSAGTQRLLSLRQSLGRRLAVGQPLPLQRQGGSGIPEQSLPGLRRPSVRFERCHMAW